MAKLIKLALQNSPAMREALSILREHAVEEAEAYEAEAQSWKRGGSDHGRLMNVANAFHILAFDLMQANEE